MNICGLSLIYERAFRGKIFDFPFHFAFPANLLTANDDDDDKEEEEAKGKQQRRRNIGKCDEYNQRHDIHINANLK